MKVQWQVISQHEWLTVDQTYLACHDAGLDRTKKTIRQWCRQGHVDCQKQITPTGERWMIDKSTLETKIKVELEFQAQSEPVQTGANPSEPVQTRDEPVQTGTNPYERLTREGESVLGDSRLEEKVARLKAELKSLEIDKAVRDRHIEFLTKQNAESQKGLLSQSRYIGHLETQVTQMGGRPDQTFLEAPVPQEMSALEPELIDPRQQPLDSVNG